MATIKLIINPHAGRGYANKVTPKIQECLTDLGIAFEPVQTTAPGEAIRLAREAVAAGFGTIVSVGGDGTTHEIINGIMAHGDGHPSTALGCIPAGSGNDFAIGNGVPSDIEKACMLIAKGTTHTLDLGQVMMDGRITRYFDNIAGTGFDGIAIRESMKFKHLRGMALYLPTVLKTIFLSMRPTPVEIMFDGQTIQTETMMITLCNGPLGGGGFQFVPDARYDDGLLDLLIAEKVSKLQMLALVSRFMKGTHLTHKHLSTRRVKRVRITSAAPLYTQVDGEILCDKAHQIDIKVIPACLRLICPRSDG